MKQRSCRATCASFAASSTRLTCRSTSPRNDSELNLAAIKKGVTSRVLSELEKLAQDNAEAYDKVWEAFGAVLKEGLYEDFERRSQLLSLARFKTTAGGGWRSIKDYAGSIKQNQTAIYYATGTDLGRLASSPQLEGFRARDRGAAPV